MRRNEPGDRSLARDLLLAARPDVDAFGMASLRSRIDALAAQLGEESPAHPCGLTEREVEVLRLATIGRNNRDIATVLAISPNTVANHMRSIFEKTYTANRTEAAAFARSNGLTPG
jgi:DNA-binding NarL/FixJ family response regulator